MGLLMGKGPKGERDKRVEGGGTVDESDRKQGKEVL